MPVIDVGEGIYRIDSRLGSRVVSQWLVAGEHPVLIDAGTSNTVDETILPALHEIGLEPTDVETLVISHADVDHYGGAGSFRAHSPRTTIAASAPDTPLITSWDAIVAARYGWYRGFGLDYERDVWDWLPSLAVPAIDKIDRILQPGEAVTVGAGRRLVVIALPGHTAGHIGLLDHQTGTAFTLDAALGSGLIDVDGVVVGPPAYVDADAYRGTAYLLRSLRPRCLATSHYGMLEGADLVAFLDRTVSFTNYLEAAVVDRLQANPSTLKELHRDLAGSEGLSFTDLSVELARSIHSHLELLTAAGAARSEGAGPTTRWSLC